MFPFSRAAFRAISCAIPLFIGSRAAQLRAQTPAEVPLVTTINPPYFGFFAKLIDCGGIPVRGGASTSDSILQFACASVHMMLENAPILRKNFALMGIELARAAAPGARNRLELSAGNDLYLNCYEAQLHGSLLHGANPANPCMQAISNMVLLVGGYASLAPSFEQAVKQGPSAHLRGAANPDYFWDLMTEVYFGVEITPGSTLAGLPDRDAWKALDPKAFAIMDGVYSGKTKPTPVVISQPHAAIKNKSLVFPGTQKLILVNDSAAPIVVTRYAELYNSSGMAGQAVGHEITVAPYSRQISTGNPREVYVIPDRDKHPGASYTLYGATTIMQVDK